MRISTFQQAVSLMVADLALTISGLATYSPGPSYAVGIPSTSSISSSTAGPLYIQISAPESYQWAGLGIGSQMQGATIFVMYADGNGNVTVGVRDGGQGHVEPQLDSALETGITLLEGSGIINGQMVANFKCTTCTLHSSSTSTSSPWICAWNVGSAIDSTSPSATIYQHQIDNTRQFTFDLTSASISSDSNPFLSSTATSSSGASSPSTTGGSGSGSSVKVSNIANEINQYHIAHGTIMGTTVVLIFPLAAIFMRLGGNIWVHALIQIFGIACLISGLGIGVKLAQLRNELYTLPGSRAYTHTVFGTTIVALFLIQPLLGLIHHLQYKRTQSRAPVSWAHIWYGRALMASAIVNGGLGLRLAANTTKGEIAYGVVAGVVGLVYIVLVVVKRKGGSGLGRRSGGRRGKGDVVESGSGSPRT